MSSASGTTATTAALTNGGGCAAAAAPNGGATDGSNERKQRIFITHVDSLGPYLKISGQLNPDAMGVVRSQVQKVIPTCYAIDPSWPVSRQQALLLPGAMCLYKRINGAAPSDFEFVRSRITKVIPAAATPTAQQAPPKVEIDIIDYGNSAIVGTFELLFPQQPEQLLNTPAMCSQYIVLGICEDWKRTQLDEIARMIAHHTLEVSIVQEFKQFKFINMKWKEFNIAEFLMHQKKMGAPIVNDLLFDNFTKIHKQQCQQQQQQKQQSAASVAVSNNNSKLNTNTNNNSYNNTNNNNYYNKNHNHVAQQQPQAQPQPHPMQSILSVNNNGPAAMAARRSLSARLQQLQHPSLQQQMPPHFPSSAAASVGHMPPHSSMQNILMPNPAQPRIPQAIGNLRSMMQGIHMQNNRIPYSGLHYPQAAHPLMATGTPALYNGITNAMAGAPPSHFSTWNARYRPPLQLMHLQQQQQQQPPPANQVLGAVTPRRTTPATFKSNNLQMGQVYDVSVSFVENGPFLFSVQLVKQQDDLTDMMNRIERVQLKKFAEKPMLGNACIARYSEDGQLYRALITGIQLTACKVAYIDYGNAEMVDFCDLYEIPEEFLKFNAFAIRFTLSGHKELEPIDDSLKKAFKDLVIYKTCKLKVMPLEGSPLVPYCELYLQDKNILHVLKQIQKTRLVYPKSQPLANNDIVEIRYIDSPKNFYVQKVENIPAFEKLMDDMFLYYNKNQNVPNRLTLGAPCIVKYDNEWYRAEVMRADATATIVRHVDFGYEQKVTKNLLSTIAEKHLKLPRQAVQCCLKGFENNELTKDLATTQFEMLAEESNRQRRSFTVKVFRIQPDGVNLVNLCTKELNVMKKLYKLSMPFEQYLTLEKEDFNIHSLNQSKTYSENGKTPSIASDVPSVHSSKKGHILNSTTLQSDELRINNKQKQEQQQQRNSYPASASEWDKQSSSSSMTENRDSRSSSSELKSLQTNSNQQRKHNYYKNYPHHKQQQQQHHQNSPSSNNSVASDKRSTASSYNSRMMGPNTPPRFQNKQRNQQHQQQQPKQQRPQNAPQGFSQNNLTNQTQQQQQQHQNHLYQQQQHQQQQLQSTQQQQKSQKQQQHNLPGNKDGMSKKSSDTSSDTSKKSQDNATQKDKDKPATYNFVAHNKAFPVKTLVTPCREKVIISWWISPHQFYTQLRSRAAEFERFMKEIQQFYNKMPLQQVQMRVGSYVMARQRKDNIVYRARIIACNQMLRKCKVQFVDFGNQYTVTSEDIWPVEKKFSDFPVMAHLCGFDGIVSNYDHLYIIDRMDKYLPQGVVLECQYIEKSSYSDLYFVNVMVENVSLKQTLEKERLITEICPELRLDLLAGQQIRAKISSIKDMLNFKIELPFHGCDNIKHIEVLCSYDDVRFVKSNQDVAKKFKQFYAGKSCVFNIKDVNDNKVVLLRPLLPLLKEDIPSYICTTPVVLETFKIRVVYVPTAYRVYGQAIANEMEMAQLLDDMYNYYENNGNLLHSFDVEKVCAAKGSDGNWYRGRILHHKGANQPVDVYYIDYGNTELVDTKFLKHLEEKFYLQKSAYAIEINLPLKTLSADAQQRQKGKKQGAGPNATNDSDIAVINQLTSLTLDKEITVKCLEVKNNHLIADLLMDDGRNMIDMLKDQKLIKCRDLDYMRKLLEKEKPNMLEYIECVDLTIEDEEEDSVSHGKSKKSKQASPKKKKNTNDKELTGETIDSNSLKKTQETSNSAEQISKPKSPIPTSQPETSKITGPVEITPPAEVAKPLQEPPKAEEPTKVATPEPVVNPYADWEHGILAHCDNPAQFFIHPMNKVKDLQKLQENLQIVASSLPPLMRIVNGAFCISMYSVDKQWYRAKILDAELMVLQFIDFGNTDCVTDTTDLKEMIVFPDVEPLCIACALPIRPNGTLDWQDAANSIFNDSYTKVLDYEFITHGEQFKKSYVNLFIEGQNITAKLIKDGYGKPLELVDSGENCYISHVNGISDFYIQYEKNSKGLELIEIYLADNNKLNKLEKFEKFKIVAALFPDDENWYRAKLLRQVSEGFEVLFIDYGNTSISPECREISQEIAELPPLSKKCSLEVPCNCKGWSEAAEQKFMEIADTGETIFSVELREPAQDHAIVHLLIDGHNINDELEELCEKKDLPGTPADMNTSLNSTLQTSVYEMGCLYEATISHVNSPCDFYIQFAKDAIRLEDMTQTLNSLTMEVLENPTKQQICAALFPEDKALYRAKILDILPDKQYRVLFIDFGNEVVTTELRTLPQDLVELKSFSRKCHLENYARFLQFGSIATETFNNLVNQCEGKVKVDVVAEGDSEQPSMVRVFANASDSNLCEQLNKQLGLDHNTQTAMRPECSEEEMLKAAKTCVISHAVSPSLFYIQRKSNSSKMEQIAKSLLPTKVRIEHDVPKKIVVHMNCLAYSSEDERFYRGRIEKIVTEGGVQAYEVFLLDYGNVIITKEVRAISDELNSFPPLAIKCQLNVIPPNVAQNVLVERFSALLETHFGEMYEIEQDELNIETGVHLVKLQVNYKDLAEELQKAVEANSNIDQLLSLVPELHECSIIHVNSPQSFYVQLNKDISCLEKITDILLDAETDFEPFTELKVGAICAAQFPEDQTLSYYRAEIVALLEDNKCEVHYIDFGNNSITDQFRKLPDDILQLERCSKHCSLDASCPRTAEVQQHFTQFVNLRFSETFQLEILKPSDILNIVRVFYQEKNIIQEVMQQMKAGDGGGDANDEGDSLGSSVEDEDVNANAQKATHNGDI